LTHHHLSGDDEKSPQQESRQPHKDIKNVEMYYQMVKRLHNTFQQSKPEKNNPQYELILHASVLDENGEKNVSFC
jgi:hypothetical protein